MLHKAGNQPQAKKELFPTSKAMTAHLSLGRERLHGLVPALHYPSPDRCFSRPVSALLMGGPGCDEGIKRAYTEWMPPRTGYMYCLETGESLSIGRNKRLVGWIHG